MQVARRGRQAAVAEQQLDRAQVRAGLEQMGGEAVAQRVRRHRLVEHAGQVLAQAFVLGARLQDLGADGIALTHPVQGLLALHLFQPQPGVVVEVVGGVLSGSLALIADAGFDPVYGARPLKRTIQRELETVVAQGILRGDYADGDTIVADMKNGGINISRAINAVAIPSEPALLEGFE